MTLLSDKYRPKSFDKVIGNTDIIKILQKILETKNMPHLLLAGPPGTGKTTCAWILTKLLLKNRDALLELNASDERGIDVVRTTIKNFAMRSIADVPFKLIILDEADSMTSAAQQAMRRTMETCLSCRFILICNSLAKIFEPIQSRCAILKFERIDPGLMTQTLMEIAYQEQIKINENVAKMIVELADGDMRQALNIMQSAVSVGSISENVVLKITGQPSPIAVGKILKKLDSGAIDEALEIFDGLWEERYDPGDIINSFFRVAKNNNDIAALKCIGPLQVRIAEGVASKLQFYSMFYQIFRAKSESI